MRNIKNIMQQNYLFFLSILKFMAVKGGRLLLLLFVVATFSFILVSHSPVDPVDAYVGSSLMRISPEQRERIAARWGMDKPPLTRFIAWGRQLVYGDFGVSSIFNEPVLSVIGKRFITSFWLMAFAWVLSGLLGFVLGLLAGCREGSLPDKIIGLYAYTMASTPTFWVGMVLLSIFSVHLGWTPVCCAWPPGSGPDQVSLIERLHHLVLPALTLSLVGIAQITLHTREKTVEAMQSEYVLFARSQGERLLGVTLGHVARNVALPAITLQFSLLGELFGGAVLTEQVFTYPGLGRATVEAGIRGDVPLLLGIVLFSTIFVYIGNTLADFLYMLVDPRMRKKEGRQC